jgi:hypothetical protein
MPTYTSDDYDINVVFNQETIGRIKSLEIDQEPGKITDKPVIGTAPRVLLHAYKLKELFTTNFVHVNSQRRPFDILVNDKSGNTLFTVKHVWITSLGLVFSAGDHIIISDVGPCTPYADHGMNFEAETILTN